MHKYAETISITILCALFGSRFVLEIMSKSACTENFCWVKTAVLTLFVLFTHCKSKVWHREYGVVVGGCAGFASPFIAHSYLLFI